MISTSWPFCVDVPINNESVVFYCKFALVARLIEIVIFHDRWTIGSSRIQRANCNLQINFPVGLSSFIYCSNVRAAGVLRLSFATNWCKRKYLYYSAVDWLLYNLYGLLQSFGCRFAKANDDAGNCWYMIGSSVGVALTGCKYPSLS